MEPQSKGGSVVSGREKDVDFFVESYSAEINHFRPDRIEEAVQKLSDFDHALPSRAHFTKDALRRAVEKHWRSRR